MKQIKYGALFSLFLMLVLVGCSKNEYRLASERGDRWLEYWGYASQLEALKKRFRENQQEVDTNSSILAEIVDRRSEIEKLIRSQSVKAFGEGNFSIQSGVWRASYSDGVPGTYIHGPFLFVDIDKEPS